MKLFEEFRRAYTSYNSFIRKIILLNVVFFLADKTASLLLWLLGMNDGWYEHFLLHLSFPFHAGTLIRQPWTLLTYMFLHQDIFHILFNMLFLFFLGNIFQDMVGNRKTAGVYFLGGFAGALLTLAFYALVPAVRANAAVPYMIGASAAVMATVAAAATLVPNYTLSIILIGPVKLKWIALFYFAIDLISIREFNGLGHVAHIGGAIMGWFFVQQLRKGNDWSIWIAKLSELSDRLRGKRKKLSVSYRTTYMKTRSSRKPSQDEVDEILDKISRSGYESLSAEEKELLFKASTEE